MDVDLDEIAARLLYNELQARNINCNVHCGRCPWGVRIPLTEEDYGVEGPSLYVLTEGLQTVAGFEDTRVWTGQLGNFNEDIMSVLYDTGFEWIERHWHGAGTASIAEMLVPLIMILKHGAANTSRLHSGSGL